VRRVIRRVLLASSTIDVVFVRGCQLSVAAAEGEQSSDEHCGKQNLCRFHIDSGLGFDGMSCKSGARKMNRKEPQIGRFSRGFTSAALEKSNDQDTSKESVDSSEH
jgi:hypothetical protein